MTEFKTGDRVRIKNLPRNAPEAGKTGTVHWIKQGADGAVVLCQVRLDGAAVYMLFAPHELEPAQEGTSP